MCEFCGCTADQRKVPAIQEPAQARETSRQVAGPRPGPDVPTSSSHAREDEPKEVEQ